MASPMPLPSRRMKSPVGYAALGAEPGPRRQTSRWVIAFAVVGTLIGAAIIGVTVSSLVTTDSARDQSRATRTAFETALYGKGHTAAGKSLGGRRATGPAAVKAARSETTVSEGGIVQTIDNMATAIGKLKGTTDTLSSAVVAPDLQEGEEGVSLSLYAIVSGIDTKVGTSDTTTIMDELAKIGSPVNTESANANTDSTSSDTTLFGKLASLATAVGNIIPVDISDITGAIGSPTDNGATDPVTLFGKLDSIETTTRPNDHGVYATYANSIGVVKSADGNKVRSYVTKLFGDDETLKVTLTTQSDWNGMSNDLSNHDDASETKCEYTTPDNNKVNGVQTLDGETFVCPPFNSNQRLYVHVSRDIGIAGMYEPVLPPLSPCDESARVSPKSFDYYNHAISAFSVQNPSDEFSDWSDGASYNNLILATVYVPGKSYTATLSSTGNNDITGSASDLYSTPTNLDFTVGKFSAFTFDGAGFSTSNLFDGNRTISVEVKCGDCVGTIHGIVSVSGSIKLPQPPIEASGVPIVPTWEFWANTLNTNALKVGQLVEKIRPKDDNTAVAYAGLRLQLKTSDDVADVYTINANGAIGAMPTDSTAGSGILNSYINLEALRAKLKKTETVTLRVSHATDDTKYIDFASTTLTFNMPYDVGTLVGSSWSDTNETNIAIDDAFKFEDSLKFTDVPHEFHIVFVDSSAYDVEVTCEYSSSSSSYTCSYFQNNFQIVSCANIDTGDWNFSKLSINHVDNSPIQPHIVPMGEFTLPSDE